MNRKVIALALAAGMTFCAFSGVLPQTSVVTTSLRAEAAAVQEYNIPVTLQKYDSPVDKSMGNAALIQMGKIVVDNEGNATLQLSFQSLKYSGQTGYLGYLNKVNDDNTLTRATVLEEYEGFTDTYNDLKSSKFDKKLYNSTTKTAWYPKTVSIPVDADVDADGNVIGLKESRIKVQVYVPVMEAISSGTGTQFAYLDVKDGLFTGSSVTIDGSVKLNTYFNFSDAFTNDTGVKAVISAPDGRTDTISVKDFQKEDGTNQYRISTQIPVKDMATQLSGQLLDGNGDVIETFSLSVAEYAMQIIANEDIDEKYVNFAAELLNYGAAAQVYFKYNYDNNDENLANYALSPIYLHDYDEDVADSELAGYTYSQSGKLSGLTYSGSTLSFLSDITIKHYFSLSETDSIDAHKFVVNGTETTPVYDETQKMYYVSVSGISAKNFDTDYTVTIDSSYTLKYCALDYCNAVVKSSSTKTSLKYLTKALYKFWEAAENV